MRYLVGWCTEGNEPDSDPQAFPTLREAQQFLRNELVWLAHDEPNHSITNKIFDAACAIERMPFTSHWHLTFPGVVYWLKPEDEGYQPHTIGFVGP